MYSLNDPRSEDPFYIGKGSGDRPKNHFYEKYETSGNRRKWCKIASIRADGLKPEIRILCEGFANESDAYDVEESYIKLYGREGVDPGGILTNICVSNRPPSALGRIVSPETCKGHSERQLGKLNHRYGKPHSEESKRKLRETIVRKKKERCQQLGIPYVEPKSPENKVRFQDKFFKIKSEINEYYFSGVDLYSFCKEHKIYYEALIKTIKTKIPYRNLLVEHVSNNGLSTEIMNVKRESLLNEMYTPKEQKTPVPKVNTKANNEQIGIIKPKGKTVKVRKEPKPLKGTPRTKEEKEHISKLMFVIQERHYILKSETELHFLTSQTLRTFCKNRPGLWYDKLSQTKRKLVPYKGWLLKEIPKNLSIDEKETIAINMIFPKEIINENEEIKTWQQDILKLRKRK